MRLFLLMLLVLFAPSISLAQGESGVSDKRDVYGIETVKFLIQERETKFSTGWGEKWRPRLGDKISIALLKIYDRVELENPERLKIYLPLIRAAFESPKLIENPEDKQPRVTLYLLEHLEAAMSDTQLKEEIVKVIKFVKGQAPLSSNNSFNRSAN